MTSALRSIQGSVVLVTGAASGMGRATAEVFAAEGAIVAASDLHGTDWIMDVSDPAQIRSTVDAIAAKHPDGQLGYYCISGEPVYDDAGTFTGYCGTGLDITVRKRTSEARLPAQAGSTPD